MIYCMQSFVWPQIPRKKTIKIDNTSTVPQGDLEKKVKKKNITYLYHLVPV